MINETLLAMLCCPETKADLVLEGEWLISVDPETRYKYPIRENIPVLLIDEAVSMEKEEWDAIMKKHGKQTA